MESKNYYDILEVSVKASAQEITLAKNKLAKRYHPDVNMRKNLKKLKTQIILHL